MTSVHPAPKPEPRAPKKRLFSSIVDHRSSSQKVSAARKLRGTKGIKSRSKKRDRNDPARIYGPKAFRDFLHSHECLGCRIRGEVIQQAHLHTGGTGRKDGWRRTVPLCGSSSRWVIRKDVPVWVITIGCHRAYDGAKESWAERHSLHAKAEQFWNRWLLHCGRVGLDPETGKP